MCDNSRVYVVRVNVRKDTNDNFYAYCPGIPAIHVSGFTEEEALSEAMKSVENIIEIYNERRESIPENKHFYAIREAKPARELKKNDILIPIPPHLAGELANCEQGL